MVQHKVGTLKLTSYANSHDIAKPVPESIEDIDQIYHLACPASPVRFVQYPVSILDTCYLGTKNVLEFARQNKARVLLSSTSGMCSAKY